MKKLISILTLISPWQSWRIIFYVGVRKLFKGLTGYPVELYKAARFVRKYGGSMAKEGDLVQATFAFEKKTLKVYLRENTSDAAVFDQVFVFAEYKPLIDLVSSLYSEPIKQIVDAGANAGYTSLFLSAFYPDASVIAVEPDKDNMHLLKKNLSANRLTFMPVEKALWNSSEYLSIHNSFRDSREWSRQVRPVAQPENDHDVLQGISLADLIGMYGWTDIDILKIDIEGAEKEVFSDLDASASFLRNVKFIVVELHEEAEFRDHFQSVLKSAGFGFTYFSESLFGFNTKLIRS